MRLESAFRVLLFLHLDLLLSGQPPVYANAQNVYVIKLILLVIFSKAREVPFWMIRPMFPGCKEKLYGNLKVLLDCSLDEKKNEQAPFDSYFQQIRFGYSVPFSDSLFAF